METPDEPNGATISAGRPGGIPATLRWIGGVDGALELLDQTRLPRALEMRRCETAEQVWEAIRALRVRGAPAIGVAGAYGLCLGTRAYCSLGAGEFAAKVREVADYLCGCRPTAVNLAWAIRRVAALAEQRVGDSVGTWKQMLQEAHTLAREDAESCRRIGENGADLIPEGGAVLTHCNAGALATVAYGTALAPMYVAHERGRKFRVLADETRPLLQGARLTAFELSAAGIDVTVVCDGAAAGLIRRGRVQLVIVGADRIAANGDTANKVGTYGVALAARANGIPFYVAAPRSTFDLTIGSGMWIVIEERAEEEVSQGPLGPTVPEGVRCHNPAFDVTPAELITGFITERGLLQPVTEAAIRDFWT